VKRKPGRLDDLINLGLPGNVRNVELATANALHPGAIKTNLQRFVGGNLKSPPEFHKTIQQGAATSVFLATSPMLDGIGGRYFYNCNEAEPVKCRPKELAKSMGGVAPYSLDLKNADRLWDESLRLISMSKSLSSWKSLLPELQRQKRQCQRL
jgi:hypothetical protein